MLAPEVINNKVGSTKIKYHMCNYEQNFIWLSVLMNRLSKSYIIRFVPKVIDNEVGSRKIKYCFFKK
jgi:hypothetical protein